MTTREITVDLADEFKIRASAAHRIMGGTIGLTEKQAIELAGYEKRHNGEGKPLTDGLEAKRIGFIKQRDNLELPEGAKTYVLEWIQEKLYGVRKSFTSKYTEKGTIVEQASIDYYAFVMGEDFILKNNDRKEDEHFTGECDLDLVTKIVDIKSVWDSSTFPLFQRKIKTEHEWQGRVYMPLWNRQEFEVASILVNTPFELVEKEARSFFYAPTNTLSYEEVLANVQKDHTFDHLSPSLRCKTFTIKRDMKIEQDMRDRVELCRVFAREQLEVLINN